MTVYDLHRLRLLRELHHRGTLAAVADALGYNPSTISHQLGLLEREVGATLLEPAGRRVRLTPAATKLVEHTENILRELEQAEAAVNALRTTVAGLVRVATFQTAAHTLLPDALARLARRHPHVQVTLSHVHAEQALPALLARDYDLVLHESYPGDPTTPLAGVTSEPVTDDELLLATPSPTDEDTASTAPASTAIARQDRARQGKARDDLPGQSGARWAMEPVGTSSRRWAVARCRAAGFEPQVAFESADVLLHARLVAAGLAVAFLPRLAVPSDAPYQVRETSCARQIWIARRTGSDTSPALTAVSETIRGR